LTQFVRTYYAARASRLSTAQLAQDRQHICLSAFSSCKKHPQKGHYPVPQAQAPACPTTDEILAQRFKSPQNGTRVYYRSLVKNQPCLTTHSTFWATTGKERHKAIARPYDSRHMRQSTGVQLITLKMGSLCMIASALLSEN
jgi:hypothetical protein